MSSIVAHQILMYFSNISIILLLLRMSCVCSLMYPILSAPGNGGGLLVMSHDTSQSSPVLLGTSQSSECPGVIMTDWKRILSEVPISPSTETHLLTSYTSSVFSDGGVSPEDMSRVVIRRVSVTWSWSPSSWPSPWRARSSSAVTIRCQEWAPSLCLRVPPLYI